MASVGYVLGAWIQVHCNLDENKSGTLVLQLGDLEQLLVWVTPLEDFEVGA